MDVVVARRADVQQVVEVVLAALRTTKSMVELGGLTPTPVVLHFAHPTGTGRYFATDGHAAPRMVRAT